MKKRTMAAVLIAAMMTCTAAQAKVNYSDLEDMSVEELEALQAEISERLNSAESQKEAPEGIGEAELPEEMQEEAGEEELPEEARTPEEAEKEAGEEAEEEAQAVPLAPDENGAIIFDEIGESLLLDDDWAAVKLTSFFQQANETRMEKGITLSVTNKSQREFNLRTYMANLESENAGIREMVPHGNLLPGQSEIYTYFITRKTADPEGAALSSIDELYTLNGQFILDVMTEDRTAFDRSLKQQIPFDFRELPEGKIFRPDAPEKDQAAEKPAAEAGEGTATAAAAPQEGAGTAAPAPQEGAGTAAPATQEGAGPAPANVQEEATQAAPQEAAQAAPATPTPVPADSVNIPVEDRQSLGIESAGGRLVYQGAMINTKNFQTFEAANANALILRFEYANKGAEAKQYYSDFQIQVTQNGVNLSGPGSWVVDEYFPAEVSDCYAQIAGGESRVIGIPIMLIDDSPVTVSVKAFGPSSNGETGTMELKLQ